MKWNYICMESAEKRGKVLLGVLISKGGCLRVLLLLQSLFERLHLLGAALSRVLCLLLQDTGHEDRL